MGIELKKFMNNADCKTPKNVLVIGVVHGDEPQGEYFIKKYLENNKRTLKNNLYYIERLNSNDKRTNKNGVDINRNFPTKNWEKTKKDDYFGGEFPNSEIETQFVVDLVSKINFDAVITLHAPYEIINYDGENNENTLPLAEKISEILNYPLQKDIGYPTKGSFGTYLGVERNIPIITVECSETTPKEILYPNFKKLFEYLEIEF